MFQSIVAVILDKGGLGYALFLAMALYWARDRERWDNAINARDVKIGELQGQRVADAQKIADLHNLRVADNQKASDTLATGQNKLTEALTLARVVMEEVRELLDGDTDPRRSKQR